MTLVSLVGVNVRCVSFRVGPIVQLSRHCLLVKIPLLDLFSCLLGSDIVHSMHSTANHLVVTTPKLPPVSSCHYSLLQLPSVSVPLTRLWRRREEQL